MPRNGLRNANAMASADLRPTINALGNPGPRVAATPPNRAAVTLASRKAVCVTGARLRKCSRVANSGTTPPYSAWSWICEETTLDNTRPACTTAAAVSSQEVSMARSIMGHPPRGLATRTSNQPLRLGVHRQSLFCRGNFLNSFARHFFEAGHAPRVESDAFQHVLGPLQLRVMHAQDLLALVLLQAIQTARAAPQEQRLFFFRGHGHADVRRDAFLVNDLVAGGVIFCRRQAQGRAVAQGQDFLHRAFAESLLADNDGVRNAHGRRVLQAAGNDFRSARAADIDENRQRQVRMRAATGRAEFTVFVRPAAFGGNNQLVFRQKFFANAGRLVEQPARIAAQIQDQRLHPLLVESL